MICARRSRNAVGCTGKMMVLLSLCMDPELSLLPTLDMLDSSYGSQYTVISLVA